MSTPASTDPVEAAPADAVGAASSADLVDRLVSALPQQVDGGWACVGCGQVCQTQDRALGHSCGGGALLVIPAAIDVVARVSAGLAALDGLLAQAREQMAALDERAAELDERAVALEETAAALAARAVQVEWTTQPAPVPAMSLLLGLLTTTANVTVTWPHPFPDTTYEVLGPWLSAVGVGVHIEVAVVTKTPEALTLRVTAWGAVPANRVVVFAAARRTGTTIPEEAA